MLSERKQMLFHLLLFGLCLGETLFHAIATYQHWKDS